MNFQISVHCSHSIVALTAEKLFPTLLCEFEDLSDGVCLSELKGLLTYLLTYFAVTSDVIK